MAGGRGSVFKKRPTDRRYSGAYYPPDRGPRRIVTLFTDKRASELELSRIIRREERIATGLEESPPPDTPIDELLDDYISDCAFKGQAKRHLSCKRLHIRRVIEAAGAEVIQDVQPRDVESLLRELSEAGLSPRTLNIHINSWRAFAKFAAKRGHVVGERFAQLTKLDERRDTRRRRRALSPNEIERLLTAARLRPVADYGRETVRRDGECTGRRTWTKAPLTPETLEAAYQQGLVTLRHRPEFQAGLERLGEDRREVYRLMLLTGMRLGEVRALRWADVLLDERYIRIQAATSKARREDEVPLHSKVVEMLARRRTREGGGIGKVFASVPGIRVFDLDIAAAGIHKIDAAGRVVDLHGLRVTTGTMLARAGVPPQVAQRILRHADINVTLRHYTHLERKDRVEGVEALRAP